MLQFENMNAQPGGSVVCDEGNAMVLRFPSLSVNESFARAVAGAFSARLDPTLEQVSDIKTAVSEAVTNAIVHAYPDTPGTIVMRMDAIGGELSVTIEDYGCGIRDVTQALEPFWSGSGNEERSGMGFTLMSTFMDSLEVTSTPGIGTRVFMRKVIR